jgi:hypothetical protein
MCLDNRAMCNVRSPPSLTSTKESIIIENKENSYLWPIVKDVSANYIFTTNGFDIEWDRYNDKTIYSQLNSLSFCTKVLLRIINSTTIKYITNKFVLIYITDWIG